LFPEQGHGLAHRFDPLTVCSYDVDVADIVDLRTAPARAKFGATIKELSCKVEKPWARATPAGAATGAVYMTISNKSSAADRLTGAASDVADKLQIHEMKVVDGVVRMRKVPGGLQVPAKRTVVLKRGGYHVMLVGLKHSLEAGDSFPLTLVFEKAGNVSITVPVKAMGAVNGHTHGTSMPNMPGLANKPSMRIYRTCRA
jgi:hypothetical protein